MTTARWRGRTASALALLALAGCGGDEQKISVDDLDRLVLTESDVGKTYTRFDSGPQLQIELRGDADRFGREGGWKARFRRADDSREGPLVVESRADVFGGDDGASKDLDAYRDELAHAPPGSGARRTPAPAPDLGEESVAAQLRQGELVFFTVAWRESNATASVTTQGFAGRTTLADAVRLARKQARRIVEIATSES